MRQMKLFCSKVKLNSDGTRSHAPWFKVVFNPILRRVFGVHIVSLVDEDNIVRGYAIKK